MPFAQCLLPKVSGLTSDQLAEQASAMFWVMLD